MSKEQVLKLIKEVNTITTQKGTCHGQPKGEDQND